MKTDIHATNFEKQEITSAYNKDCERICLDTGLDTTFNLS